ncbi:uncharacterized protein LOC125334422 [Corvus hawaiiensis]|uniref:uncharacterized protein LOC125334422 n=1 Tax=Corvus hawaiiensis TaxID=134902 RepID=UPI00201A10C8|nr:uncharacterized protein LOC125334422 [Corvus hawaiiensis]
MRLEGNSLVTSQPLGTAWWLVSVPSPSPCPEPRQKSAGKDVQSLFSGGSSSVSSTMLSQGLLRLLPLSLLLLLVQPLDPSSHAAGDTGSWDALPQALEEQEAVAPGRDAMLVLEALPWICAAVALILRGFYVGWVLVRGLRRRWGEVREGLRQVGRCRGRHGLGPGGCGARAEGPRGGAELGRPAKSQSAGASARPCCQGHGCSEELLQLLLENQALMKMSLLQSSRQRPVPRGRRRRNAGTQKSRLHLSPLLRLPSPSSSLGLVDMAGNV